jgi:hypothetical protein
MSAFPSSNVGLPATLKFDLPPSLPDSARAYSVNVAPDGITQVVGSNNANNIFVANSTGLFGNFTSQIVSFTIPSGMSQSVFMDPMATTLSFTMSYTTTTTISGLVAPNMNLIGSGASWFDQLVLYSNNTPIETVNQYGLLQNFLLQNTVNTAERNGGLSISAGCDSANGLNGIELGYAPGTYTYSFTIPLLSVIGVNTDKFFPVGSVNNLQLQMSTANLVPIVSYCTGVATSPVMGAITLNNFTLSMKYIDVGDVAGALLNQTLQNGKWFLKSTTYTNSAVNIASGSVGAQQLLLQIRNTSVKSILHQFGISQSATAPNGLYDALNISLNSRQCQIGGMFFPNKNINDVSRASEGYPYLIQALTQGGGIAKAYGTCVSRDMYLTNISALTGLNADSSYTTISGGIRSTASGADATYANVSKYPASFYCGYDLEKSSGILFQGVNTRAQPPFLSLNIGTSLPSNVLCNAWGMSDVILEIDTVAKQVTAFI